MRATKERNCTTCCIGVHFGDVGVMCGESFYDDEGNWKGHATYRYENPRRHVCERWTPYEPKKEKENSNESIN